MGKYMGGVSCNITQIKKYTHLCNMLKKDFAINIWIPTLTSAPNKRKQAKSDSDIHLCYSHPSREICLLMCLFP